MDKRDFFAHKARDYEQEARRVDNVTRISELILSELNYDLGMRIMDFGSGTGLLLERIAPFVGSITAVDMSRSMNDVLQSKIGDIECDVEIVELDLSNEAIDATFDGIISSMTIHHVEDIGRLFKTMYEMLEEGGSIALADLDTEDGTFHTEDTGVFHFGFDREEFLSEAKKAGFKNLKIQSVGDVVKPYGNYGVFLLTGNK